MNSYISIALIFCLLAEGVSAARLWSSGFELNSTAADVEFTLVNNGTIVSSPAQTGGRAGRLNPSGVTTAQNFIYQFQSSDSNGPFFFRFYIRVASLPTETEAIAYVSTSTTIRKIITMNSSGQLVVLEGVTPFTQIGNQTPALSTNTWYRVEFSFDGSSGVTRAYLNGTAFCDATGSTGNYSIFVLGKPATADTATFDLYYDDLAINDSSGSFQNSMPGQGFIVHLKPNAVGDNSGWTNDYLSVDEETPDDATTVCATTANNITDDHNAETLPSTFKSSDIIKVIQVGMRFRVDAAGGTTPTFVGRIKATASGTVQEGSSLNPTTTTWVTNATAAPFNHSLTIYDLPGAGTTGWNKLLMDSMQIGYRSTNNPTNNVQVSAVWALVEWQPGMDASWHGTEF